MKFVLGLFLLISFSLNAVCNASDGPETKTEFEKVLSIDLESADSTDSITLRMDYGMFTVFSFEVKPSAIKPKKLDLFAFFRCLMKDYNSRHS